MTPEQLFSLLNLVAVVAWPRLVLAAIRSLARRKAVSLDAEAA